MIFLNWFMAHMTTTIFWQFVAFAALVSITVWAIKAQKQPANGVNFLELIYEPGVIPARLAPERFAYTGTFLATTVGFIFGVTRPSVTAEGIALLMGTYGSLWVIGSGVKKFADRPPAPVTVVQPPTQPAIQVNTGNAPPPIVQDGVQQ